MEVSLRKLIKHMHDYQKDNHITGRCMDNSLYLSDSIKMTALAGLLKVRSVKVRSVFVFIPNYHLEQDMVIVHLIVEADGTLYEPSYEITSYSGYRYFYTFRELLDFLPIRPTTDMMRFLIEKLKKFSRHADDINRGDIRVSNLEYYHGQADYVERAFRAVDASPVRRWLPGGGSSRCPPR